MAVNGSEFRWSKRAEQAALLVAQDEIPDRLIAQRCRIGERTLERWKQHDEFAARVRDHVETWRAELKAKGIAERQNRIDAQNDRHARLQRVIGARAEEHKDVPGGDTGLLVRQVKLVKAYDAGRPDEDDQVDEELEGQPHGGALKRQRRRGGLQPLKLAVEVEEYAVDTGLLKEMRELEELVAKETGQRSHNVTLTRDVIGEAKAIAEELGIPVEQVLREAGIDTTGAGGL